MRDKQQHFDPLDKLSDEELKEAYKKALETGDADALYEAQQNIARIANEEANLKKLKA